MYVRSLLPPRSTGPAIQAPLSHVIATANSLLQTFINAPISFTTLERTQFAILQRELFPPYFAMQTLAPIVLALTYPGNKKFLGEKLIPQGLSGVLDAANRWTVLVPLTAACVTGLVNWVYLLPETNKVTAQRRLQG